MYNREKTKKLSCPEKIIAVTNRKLCDGDFLDQIKKITDLGIRAVILRKKDMSEAEYETLAAQVLDICRDTDTTCILHNFPMVAERLECGYLHLPLPVFHYYIEEIRKKDVSNILSYSCWDDSSIIKMEREVCYSSESGQSNLDKINVRNNDVSNEDKNTEVFEQNSNDEMENISLDRKIYFQNREHLQNRKNPYNREKLCVGTSVHSIEQAKEAIALGVSYVTAGHIFSTQCKPGLAPRGIDFLKNICQTVQVPVFGIGGIHPDNMQQVLDAGAAGVCMMSEMMRL